MDFKVKIRRAAVSAAANIVERCARRTTTREYVNLLGIATGSASEARYLVDIAGRLGFLSSSDAATITQKYTELLKGLKKLVGALENRG